MNTDQRGDRFQGSTAFRSTGNRAAGSSERQRVDDVPTRTNPLASARSYQRTFIRITELNGAAAPDAAPPAADDCSPERELREMADIAPRPRAHTQATKQMKREGRRFH